MSARQQCKDVGLYGITELSKLTGKTRQTIYNWYKNEYDLFLTLLVGAVVKKNFKDDNCIAIGKKLEVFKILFEIKEQNNELY